MTALLLLTRLAAAHVGAPLDSIDVHPVQGNPSGRILEASVGLVVTSDGDDWRWVCHEAVTTPDAVVAPRYAAESGRTLAWVPDLAQARTEADAVYWTDDHCEWTPSTGLTGETVDDVALFADGTVALAVTDDGDGTDAIYRSTDGGQSFSLLEDTVTDGIFTGITVSATGVAIASVEHEESHTELWWSTDGGSSWAVSTIERQTPDGAPIGLQVGALHPTNPATAYIWTDLPERDVLLRTNDAGTTWTPVLEADGFITDVSVGADNHVWVGLSGQGWLSSDNGIDFSLSTSAPPGLGVHEAADATWVASRFELLNEALYEGTEAGGFTPVFSFYDLDGPLDCPADSTSAQVCDPLYGILENTLFGTTGDTGLPDDDPDTDEPGAPATEAPTTTGGSDTKGSGCAQAPVYGGGLLALVAVALTGRRRATPPPSRPG